MAWSFSSIEMKDGVFHLPTSMSPQIIQVMKTSMPHAQRSSPSSPSRQGTQFRFSFFFWCITRTLIVMPGAMERTCPAWVNAVVHGQSCLWKPQAAPWQCFCQKVMPGLYPVPEPADGAWGFPLPSSSAGRVVCAMGSGSPQSSIVWWLFVSRVDDLSSIRKSSI